MSTYRFIERQRGHYTVRELCRVLGVAPSAYYTWRQQRPASAWERAVCRAFARHARRYGARRLRTGLQAAGYQVGRCRIRRVLRQHGLHAQQPRSFMPRTTDSGHGQRIVPNRLLGQPQPTQPHRVWVGDITCLPKQDGGWLYLASWQDAYSRKVVGWNLRETMSEDLVSEALHRALAVRQPMDGLLVHSDQVSQYTATRFRDLLVKHGAEQSMSRRGNCYDNAQAESFWSWLKTELLDGGCFAGLAETRLEVAHYIAYYNGERCHSALDYQSPNYFKIHFQPVSQLCPA